MMSLLPPRAPPSHANFRISLNPFSSAHFKTSKWPLAAGWKKINFRKFQKKFWKKKETEIKFGVFSIKKVLKLRKYFVPKIKKNLKFKNRTWTPENHVISAPLSYNQLRNSKFPFFAAIWKQCEWIVHPFSIPHKKTEKKLPRAQARVKESLSCSFAWSRQKGEVVSEAKEKWKGWRAQSKVKGKGKQSSVLSWRCLDWINQLQLETDQKVTCQVEGEGRSSTCAPKSVFSLLQVWAKQTNSGDSTGFRKKARCTKKVPRWTKSSSGTRSSWKKQYSSSSTTTSDPFFWSHVHEPWSSALGLQFFLDDSLTGSRDHFNSFKKLIGAKVWKVKAYYFFDFDLCLSFLFLLVCFWSLDFLEGFLWASGFKFFSDPTNTNNKSVIPTDVSDCWILEAQSSYRCQISKIKETHFDGCPRIQEVSSCKGKLKVHYDCRKTSKVFAVFYCIFKVLKGDESILEKVSERREEQQPFLFAWSGFLESAPRKKGVISLHRTTLCVA